MPVAETKAPALGQALGEWAAGTGDCRGACVLENKGIVPWGEAGGPWQPTRGHCQGRRWMWMAISACGLNWVPICAALGTLLGSKMARGRRGARQILSKHLGPLGGHSSESPCWGLQHGPPSAPLGCRTGAPTGSEVAALQVPPHPALWALRPSKCQLAFPQNKGWYFSSAFRGDSPSPSPGEPPPGPVTGVSRDHGNVFS